MSARLIADMEREATRCDGRAEGFRHTDKALASRCRAAARGLRVAIDLLTASESAIGEARNRDAEA